eukprot:9494047-Pyramimonas_sp.AAC.1
MGEALDQLVVKPETMRMDMGGSRAAERMRDRMRKQNIKFDLAPTGARQRLGPMERNHTLRRGQLSKCHL